MEGSILKVLVVYDKLSSITLIKELNDKSRSHLEFSYLSEKEFKLKNHSYLASFKACILIGHSSDKSVKEFFTSFIPYLSFIPTVIVSDEIELKFSKKLINEGFMDILHDSELKETQLLKSLVFAIERHRKNGIIEDSEHEYSDLFYNTPLPMIVFDKEDQRVVKANHAATKIFGFTEQKLKTFDVRKFQPIDSFKRTAIDVFQALPKNEVQFLGSFRYQVGIGDIKYFDIFVRSIKQSNREYRLAMATDVTQRVLFDQLLSKAIFEAQENERFEIGAELHDNVCQILTAGQLSLDLLEEFVNPENLFLQKGKQMFKQAIDEIRRLSHRLAPAFLDDSPLDYAIAGIVESAKTCRFKLKLRVSKNLREMTFSKEIQLHTFRILQEQIQNIAKHANAENVSISLSYKAQNLYVKIKDDGIGFNPDKVRGGIGLNNIKRRINKLNGEFEINSSIGNGCEMKFKIPDEQSQNYTIEEFKEKIIRN